MIQTCQSTVSCSASNSRASLLLSFWVRSPLYHPPIGALLGESDARLRKLSSKKRRVTNGAVRARHGLAGVNSTSQTVPREGTTQDNVSKGKEMYYKLPKIPPDPALDRGLTLKERRVLNEKMARRREARLAAKEKCVKKEK